ncbi:MAG: hypothetical protein P4L85_21575 [Paludisphaera borealis]|uniref:hypothetical protein n=1 Tax=Paludisphaera borealis TaxID=1387353 RepID=UPI0028418A8D|nr:hypothetical protein [Paludisphaera borealis]MDR3621955.1 hypothetical protein [Paludisphaera borealis]
MTSTLLPQAFWFRVAASCPKVEGIPLPSSKGSLLDLPETCKLPELTVLDGRPSWASVRVGWNAEGLGISILADGLGANAKTPDRPEGFATVNVWIDTRDTRNVSRATRYGHRFLTRLKLSKDKKSLTADVEQRPIARATADAPLAPSDLLASRVELQKSGWSLELFFPARALHGFDPETNRRLGFAYQISDHDRDDQFLGIGREFPLGENPSLWSTLELQR